MPMAKPVRNASSGDILASSRKFFVTVWLIMRQLFNDRILGWISVAGSAISLAVFHSAYVVAGRYQTLLNPALIAGKTACWIASVAALLGALGIAIDRRKGLAVAALLLGWLSGGWIGMFVYNI
jgi:hypothetical protein